MTLHRVLLFAGLRELCGRDAVEVELEPGSRVSDLLASARSRYAALESASFRVALDATYAEDATVVPESCEIAFIPPVSGG